MMKTKPRPAHIVMGVSALLLVIASAWFAVAGLGSLAGQGATQRESAGQSRANASESNTTQQSAEANSPVPARISEVGELVPQVELVKSPAPIALEIPAIDVVSEVVPVGVDSDQQVVIPEDISQVGWYRFGATPGAGVGSSVIVGHRDGRNYGVGAFYDLGRLDIGDPISVTNEAGTQLTYQVTGVETINKSKLPIRELFRETGEETLTLISCIGYFEPGVGYDANIIVSAEPRASVNNSSKDSQKS